MLARLRSLKAGSRCVSSTLWYLPSPDRADAVAMSCLQHETVVDLGAHKAERTISHGILQMDW
jgi:hypothetical protein